MDILAAIFGKNCSTNRDDRRVGPNFCRMS